MTINAAEIIEVGPRDGFQNLNFFIPTDVKLQIIDQLIASNIKRIEVTSFPDPKVLSQFDDSKIVLSEVKKKYLGQVECIVSALSLAGAQNAVYLGADAVTYVVSASEQHHSLLTKQTLEQSLAGFAELNQIKGKTKARFSISAAFACPLGSKIPPATVLNLLEKGIRLGADEFNLADTAGSANPRQVRELLSEVAKHFPDMPTALHLHDTYGMGLANALTALSLGYSRFECSVGGLGSPLSGAAGNIATEDMVNMFTGMDIQTGVMFEKLIGTAKMLKTLLNVELSGHLAKL
jgi:hydroxymethylglutaryl-CoA lyase